MIYCIYILLYVIEIKLIKHDFLFQLKSKDSIYYYTTRFNYEKPDS